MIKRLIVLVACFACVLFGLTNVITKMSNDISTDINNNFNGNFSFGDNVVNNPNACTADCENISGEHIELKKANLSSVNALFKYKEDAILFIGFDACPWCEDLLPVVKDIVDDYDLDDITYYLNTRPDGLKENDIRYSDNEIYLDLYGKVEPFLGEDKTLYAPTLVYIKDGIVKDIHVGTLETHNAKEADLTQGQVCEITEILISEMSAAELLNCN